MVFGPVPSRRLGMSLGINTIPYKNCSYSCVYCQLGPTRNIQIHRGYFYDLKELVEEVRKKLHSLSVRGVRVDYLTLVTDGEPTLDKGLGRTIEALKQFGIKIAVLTNGSLLGLGEVQKDLMSADLVSIKVDALSEDVWKSINRPHPNIDHINILLGILDFSKNFSACLLTETMLIESMNDDYAEIIKIAAFLQKLNPNHSYITLPLRPPAETGIKSPSSSFQKAVLDIFHDAHLPAELLNVPEGNNFPVGDQFEENVLSIVSVHPMREETLRKLANRSGYNWQGIERMVKTRKLHKKVYNQETYYSRY